MKEQGRPLLVNLALGVHSKVFTSVTTWAAPANRDYDGQQVVGVDPYRRRSVIVRQSETGERLGVTRIDNDPFASAEQVAGWGSPRMWCWRQRTAGTGRSTCWPPPAPGCTWLTRSG
jgi:hypothetical protein